MFAADVHLASNASLPTSAIVFNASNPAPRMRLDTSNTTTSSNASVGEEAQFSHQDIEQPPPYDILSLGTAYILGNIGKGSNIIGTSNISSESENKELSSLINARRPSDILIIRSQSTQVKS
jgi:hypothetical protein